MGNAWIPAAVARVAATAVCVLLLGCGPVAPPTDVDATVLDIMSDHVFVVGRTEPPRQTLLVLSPARTGLQPSDPVTIAGQVLRFRYAEFSAPFWLSERSPFRPYENRKFVLASEIKAAYTHAGRHRPTTSTR
jgi:hypothetical protein